MTHEQKVNYLRISLAMQGIVAPNKVSDQVITTYETILEKEGRFSLEDACNIEQQIEKKYAQREVESESQEGINEQPQTVREDDSEAGGDS